MTEESRHQAEGEYLFPNLYTDGEDISTPSVCTDAKVEERITHFGT